MGDRYYLRPVCPHCGHLEDEDYYYAPTSGFMTHTCEKCKKEIDLEKLSGIDAISTATTEYGAKGIQKYKDSKKMEECFDYLVKLTVEEKKQALEFLKSFFLRGRE